MRKVSKPDGADIGELTILGREVAESDPRLPSRHAIHISDKGESPRPGREGTTSHTGAPLDL